MELLKFKSKVQKFFHAKETHVIIQFVSTKTTAI